MPLPKHTPGGTPNTRLLQAHIREEIVLYFERLNLGHGWRQSFISDFFEKLHSYLTEELKLPPQWEPDNVARLSEVLSQLSFTSSPSKSKKKKQ